MRRRSESPRVGRRGVLAALGAAAASALALVRGRRALARSGPIEPTVQPEASETARRARKPPIWIGHM